MIRDQNRIGLMVQNGYHEEYTLDPSDTGLVLPGSIVATKTPGIVASQAANFPFIEPLIVKENALIGGTINRPSRRGEVVLLYRGVSGDRFLLRAVVGTYQIGDTLYTVQTANGVYVTKTKTEGQSPFAIAIEDFTVTAEIMDLKDESTPCGLGKNEVPNGGIVNLLRVRLA